MIERYHSDTHAKSCAVYSDCGTYRYALTREWGNGARLLYVMLNPSTASELRNDPTVERCERRARALGYGAFRVVNIFAFRATDPRDLKAAKSPIGPENDRIIAEAALWSDAILCAWGTHGDHLERGPKVAGILRRTGSPLLHLGLTRSGAPRHPLYVAYAQKPQRWSV